MKYDITLKKIEDENSKLKAIATINIGDAFTVKGVKVYEGKDGLFVSMPNYNKDGEYKDICYPTTASFREKLNNVILDKYKEIEKNKDQEMTQNEPDNNRKKHKSR